MAGLDYDEIEGNYVIQFAFGGLIVVGVSLSTIALLLIAEKLGGVIHTLQLLAVFAVAATFVWFVGWMATMGQYRLRNRIEQWR